MKRKTPLAAVPAANQEKAGGGLSCYLRPRFAQNHRPATPVERQRPMLAVSIGSGCKNGREDASVFNKMQIFVRR